MLKVEKGDGRRPTSKHLSRSSINGPMSGEVSLVLDAGYTPEAEGMGGKAVRTTFQGAGTPF